MKKPLLALATVAVLTLTACGGDGDTDSADTTPTPEPTTASSTPTKSASPSMTPSPSPTEESPTGAVVQIKIEGESATPIAEQVELKVGETLTLAVTSDRSGELHVHSTPEQEIAYAAGSKNYTLTFDKPGTVDIEDHDSDVLLVRALVR